jgi:hypothetical protein
MTADQLHIDSPQGRTVIEYRIHHGHIEVREPAEGGEAGPSTAWRRLSAREFSSHLAQNPALAQWLRARAQRSQPAPEAAQDESSAA